MVVLHGTHGPRRGEAYYLAMTEDLARHGYVAVFLRYYDRGRKKGGRGVRSQWRASIGHALDYLQTLPTVDTERMGLVGYSQGAFMALNYAPRDPRVQAVSALYGGLSPGFLPDAQQHMPPVLLLHGTADRIVPVRRALETYEWLRAAGKPVDLIVYPTVGHGFTLHERGGWDEVAGADAWQRTLDFLDYHLQYDSWLPESATAQDMEADPATQQAAPSPSAPPAPPPNPDVLPQTLPESAFPPELARFRLGEAQAGTAENPLALPPLRVLPYLDAPHSEKGRDFVLVNPDPAEVRALAAKHAPPRKKTKRTSSGTRAKTPAAKAPHSAPAPGKAPAKAGTGTNAGKGAHQSSAKPPTGEAKSSKPTRE